MDTLREIFKAISVDDASGLADAIHRVGNANLKDSSDYSLLHWTAQNGASECFKVLCDAGASIDVVDVDGNSPAMIAAAYGRESMLAEVIARGGKTLRRPDGHSALHAAAAIGSVECVQKLLGVIPESTNERDNNGLGRTPLHWACQEGHLRVVDELIASGADLESVSDNQFTALRIAAAEGHCDIVRLLVRAGATVDQRVEQSDRSFSGTALHDAVAWDRYDVVKLLLDAGADRNLTDQDGKTALEYAQDSDIVELLRASAE